VSGRGAPRAARGAAGGRRIARVLAGAVLLSAALLPAGCGDLLYRDAAPQAALLTLEYGPSFQEGDVSGGIEEAFAAVDAAYILLMRAESEETVFERVVGVTRSGGEIRVRTEVELDGEAAIFFLVVELLSGEDPLFYGWGDVELRGGRVNRPEVDLEPIVARIVFDPADPPRLTSVGERIQLAAYPAFATGHTMPGRPVEWRSLDPDVVSVSDTGEVTALRAGSGRVEARYTWVTGVLVVEVAPEPASVEVDPSEVELGLDQTLPLAAVVRDSGGGVIEAEVIWSSSAPQVASVSETGEVTGVTEGTATIQARAGEVTGHAEVVVRRLSPTVSTLSATDVGVRSAALRGNVNPNGLETLVWFEWSPSPDLDRHESTSPLSLAPATFSVTLSSFVEGLDPETTYHYRVVAESEAGVSHGAIRSFTTQADSAFAFRAEPAPGAAGSGHSGWSSTTTFP
jgi:hypothetical protein